MKSNIDVVEKVFGRLRKVKKIIKQTINSNSTLKNVADEVATLLPETNKNISVDRQEIAKAFIVGEGIEVGALHNPLKVSSAAKVKYVDRISNEELRRHYPELKDYQLVELDIIDNGEELFSIEDETQDFVIANHFLEHCENPLQTIVNMFRVLKSDGVLFLAVPDARFTFDADRPLTTIEHLRKDFEQGPAWSREQHFDEWARYVWTRVTNGPKLEAEIQQAAKRWSDMNYSIHFHAWHPKEILEILLECEKILPCNFEVEFFTSGGYEVITVLRKK